MNKGDTLGKLLPCDTDKLSQLGLFAVWVGVVVWLCNSACFAVC